jgi:thermostable 8-oxoguanine DNA glycosylase
MIVLNGLEIQDFYARTVIKRSSYKKINMSNFIITDKDIEEAKRYYKQDRIKEITLNNLFRGMLYCFLSIGELYKKQMMIYRDLINLIDKIDDIYNLYNYDELEIITSKARFPKSIYKYIFYFSYHWDLYKDLFEWIIKDIKSGRKNAYKIRDELVDYILGVGYKVASLFLDICGYNDIAVVDIWSLRFLKEMEYPVLYNSMKKGGLSKNQYLQYEKYMEKEAKKHGFSLAFFQLLVWVKTSSWRKEHNPDQLLLDFKE